MAKKNLRHKVVCVPMCVCVCMAQGGEPPQCVKDTEIGGKCVKGPYPSVLHIFAEAAVGAWLTDERGVRG